MPSTDAVLSEEGADPASLIYEGEEPTHASEGTSETNHGKNIHTSEEGDSTHHDLTAVYYAYVVVDNMVKTSGATHIFHQLVVLTDT